MQVVSEAELAGRDSMALAAFLERCRQVADRDGEAVFASISLRVGHLDPLAVLAAIDEPGHAHLYVERPQDDFALAAAEAVTSITAAGAGRWVAIRDFAARVVQRTFAIGDLDAPCAGPTFALAATFAEADPGDGFPAAHAFLPRWQVVAHPEGYTAVANLKIAPGAALEPLAARVLAAHQRFRSFDYHAVAPRGTGGREPQAALVPATAPPGLAWRELGRDYPAAVAEALQAIDHGDYEKIVLGRAIETELPDPIDSLAWLTRLREQFPGCWLLSSKAEHPRRFVAATPERLISVRQGQAEVDAIAGTTPRGATAQADAALAAALLKSEKNHREHATVVAAIRQRLEGLGLTVTGPGQPRLLRLGNVQHLRTPLSCQLAAGQHLLDLAAALHPTPALGGRPREAAVPEIRRLEGFPRGLFGGVIGWFNHSGDGDLLVGIRCAEVEGPRCRLFAGAGIVAGSDPDNELHETDCKLQALRGTLSA